MWQHWLGRAAHSSEPPFRHVNASRSRTRVWKGFIAYIRQCFTDLMSIHFRWIHGGIKQNGIVSPWREYHWTLESGAAVRKSLVAITVHQPCANIHPQSRAGGMRGTGSLIKHYCTTGCEREEDRETQRKAFQASSIMIMWEEKKIALISSCAILLL